MAIARAVKADSARPATPVRRVGPATVICSVLLGVFVVALAAIDVVELRTSFFAWDFRAFYEGGSSYLHFRSPYVSPSLANLTSHQNFVYPVPTAALFAPLSLVPYHAAAALFLVVNVVALGGALYVLGVRDMRCYLAVLIGAPAFDGLQIGTISPVLALLLAVVWRYRDRTWIAAAALALLVLTKLFLWPVGVWLLATRRLKTVVGATVASVLAVLLTAIPLGLGVLSDYPKLLRAVSAFEGTSSLSLVTLGDTLTGSRPAGYALMFLIGGLLLAAVGWFGWRGDESRAFRLSVVASLALTPILWNHYLVLLFVPLALIRPRFSPIWLGSAWMLGAVAMTMRGGSLAVVIVVLWAVMLVQAGVVDRVVLPRLGRARPVAAALALCAGLVGVLIAVLPVVPAVASLRSPTGSPAASGSADVRLLRDAKVCLRIRSEGVQGPALAQVVERGSGAVLVTIPLSGDEMCRHYSQSLEPRNLAAAFADGQARLELRIVSWQATTILAGSVVRLEDTAPARPGN